MKHRPALDGVIGASHARIARVDVHTATGTRVATLPIGPGSDVTATAARTDRWAGRLQLVDPAWQPESVTHPLAGFVPHQARVFAGVRLDGLDQLVEVARLWIRGTRVRRDGESGQWTAGVDLISLDRWVADGAAVDYRPDVGRSCQQAIVDLYRSRAPRGHQVLVRDTTAPVPVPAGFAARQVAPGELVASLSAIANITAYADAAGRLLIRPPLPATPRPPARTFDVDVDVAGYELAFGRDDNFANRVRLEFEPIADVRKARLESTWALTTAGTPTSGQLRVNSTHRITVHELDQPGQNRRRSLDRLEAGDLLEVLYRNGSTLVAEVESATRDSDSRTWQVDVRTIDTDGAAAASGTVTLSLFATPPEVVGTAARTAGTLGTTQAGAVDYVERRLGNPTQAQADARAAALLEPLVRGWATTVLDVVPDPRVEPDDDVAVRYLDGTTAPHRVTSLQLPLTPDAPMTLGLRTFDTSQQPSQLPEHEADLQPLPELELEHASPVPEG